MLKRLPFTLALLVCLLLPAGAQAHRRPVHHPTTDPVTLALKLAERYWGSAPCNGDVDMTVSTIVPALEETTPYREGLAEGGEAAMWTAFETPNGPQDFSDPPSAYTDCTITVSLKSWPSWHAADFEFQEYCDEITHEVGHLFGHDDAGQTNPDSIEYPFLTYVNYNSVPECRGLTLWYGRESFRDPSAAEVECETRRSHEAAIKGRDEWESCEI